MENNEYPIVTNVKLEDLPSVITKTFNRISEIENKLKNAENNAKTAEKSANEAKQKSAGWSWDGKDKKLAIEALQQAVVDQAECVSSTIEANKEILDNQKELSKAVNYLFGLGVVNVAANRTVVRQLEMKLRDASKEELSEFARIEIESVIKQLRAREDIQDRINGHDALFQEHKSILDSNKKDLGELDEKVKGAESRIDGHDTLFQEHNERLEAIEKDIADIQKKLNQKSFFDTTLFKIIVSLIAIVALALHLFIV
ncbi:MULTISPECIES: hypothetical protein [unclassified Bacteroides]|uniref:hypothetical protein n=1 Tax=unclassified Bacteroides TaxID=2646097 RepID=UPI0004E21613|nr:MULTISPECIES: hypothetical protein [unclassified Bacteroides]